MIFGVHVCPNTRRLVKPIFKTFLFATFSELFYDYLSMCQLEFLYQKELTSYR